MKMLAATMLVAVLAAASVWYLRSRARPLDWSVLPTVAAPQQSDSTAPVLSLSTAEPGSPDVVPPTTGTATKPGRSRAPVDPSLAPAPAHPEVTPLTTVGISALGVPEAPLSPPANIAGVDGVTAVRTDTPIDTVTIPISPAVPAAAITSTAASESTAGPRADLAAVQRVVARYGQIYQQLDVTLAASIWPGVDARGLARAFATIERQDLRFDRCVYTVAELRAKATCTGSLTYVPKIGNPTPRTAQHAWSIDLQRAGEEWQIVDVKAR